MELQISDQWDHKGLVQIQNDFSSKDKVEKKTLNRSEQVTYESWQQHL